jgi:hypothetical protein
MNYELRIEGLFNKMQKLGFNGIGFLRGFCKIWVGYCKLCYTPGACTDAACRVSPCKSLSFIIGIAAHEETRQAALLSAKLNLACNRLQIVSFLKNGHSRV